MLVQKLLIRNIWEISFVYTLIRILITFGILNGSSTIYFVLFNIFYYYFLFKFNLTVLLNLQNYFLILYCIKVILHSILLKTISFWKRVNLFTKFYLLHGIFTVLWSICRSLAIKLKKLTAAVFVNNNNKSIYTTATLICLLSNCYVCCFFHKNSGSALFR